MDIVFQDKLVISILASGICSTSVLGNNLWSYNLDSSSMVWWRKHWDNIYTMSWHYPSFMYIKMNCPCLLRSLL